MASLIRSTVLRSSIWSRGLRTSAVCHASGPYSSSGGHVGDVGGKFKEREQAAEEAYFRKQTAEQLKALKEYMAQKKTSAEQIIKDHEEEIRKHKAAIDELHDDMSQVEKAHDEKSK